MMPRCMLMLISALDDIKTKNGDNELLLLMR